jgi:hypothetical protein
MIDVVVTVASFERVFTSGPGETEETTYYPVTKVHRLEFETEEQVERWLATGATRAVSSEQLVAKEEMDDFVPLEDDEPNLDNFPPSE